MKTTIFYYTGTGNSLWVARMLANGLENADLISISSWMKEKHPIQAGRIGLVFPDSHVGSPAPDRSALSRLSRASITNICSRWEWMPDRSPMHWSN